MHPTLRKVFIFAGSIFLFLIIFLTAYGYYRPKIISYLIKEREARLLAQSEKITADIERAYANDFDGGKTPEETLDLFLIALKAGDAVKASKYYELSIQPKALESLKKELKEKGSLQSSISYFEEVRTKGEKKCDENNCNYKYVYVTTEAATSTVRISNQNITLVTPVGSQNRKIIDLTLNKKTGIWKIQQPY